MQNQQQRQTQTQTQKQYVLDISHYSFKEILELFNLDYKITVEDLKRAKKIVLMTHPDKSKLPPEYFLFYKKAFDQVIHYYNNMEKQNQSIPEKCSYSVENNTDAQISNQVKSAIQQMNANEFHSKFNTIFETTMARRVDPTRNQWFSAESPVYESDEPVTKANMNAAFERVKEKQHSQVIAKYNGVSNLCQGSGTNFYEEVDEDNDDYLTADIFGKLKFDDIRKVHKDQTVFAVSERDYQNVPKYSSVEQFTRARDKDDLTPLEKARAEQLLEQQKRIQSERIQHKMHKINVMSETYSKKTNEALSSFLMLKG